jgi:predicted Zn-dependent peptidase
MTDFYKERDVVAEEYTGSVENRPYGKMNQALLSAAFKEGGYGWPVIGIKEDLVKLEASDAEAFKKRLYVPSRMTGAIAGDIDIGRAKGLIERYFGRFGGAGAAAFRPRDLKPAHPKGRCSDQKCGGIQRRTVIFDASKNLMMAFHKPTLPTRDDYVFDVITYLMCFGENSRLTKRLVYEKRLLRSVACDSSVPGARFDNLFLMLAEPMGGVSYKEAEGAVDAELERLKEEKVTAGELEKVLNNLSRDFYFEVAANEGIAQELVSYQTLAGDWRYMTRRLAILETITPEDIMDAAKRYFVDDNMVVVELERP